ncbi:MAG TPA: hypothetical protein VF595_02905 [Tepidisphaeraceae bacterium]
MTGHTVETAYEAGWSDLENGQLIAAAETQFDVLITTDQSLKYQQKLVGRRLAILVLMTTSWPKLKPHGDVIAARVALMMPGSYDEFNVI